MAINFIAGDLFRIQTEAIVIPVNTMGAMGKGVALQCAQRHRDLEAYYKLMCRQRRLRIGNALVWKRTLPWIICTPTKTHWRQPSTTGYIFQACSAIRNVASEFDLENVALPWLGCGEGGLSEEEVKPILTAMLSRDMTTTYHVVSLKGSGRSGNGKDLSP